MVMQTSIPTSTTPQNALTTTFVPPNACLSQLWAASASDSTWMNLGPVNTSQCLPSGWSPSSTFSSEVCPSGWKLASNVTTKISNEPVTIGTCCPQYLPSGWIFSTRPETSLIYPWYATEICQWSPTTTVYYGYSWTSRGTILSTPGSMAPGGVWNAYGLLIKWQSRDEISTGAPLATTSATATSMAPKEHFQDTQPSLSRKQKIGIGLGVGLGGAIAVSIILFILFSKQQHQAFRQSQSRISRAQENLQQEFSVPEKPELDSAPLHEAG